MRSSLRLVAASLALPAVLAAPRPSSPPPFVPGQTLATYSTGPVAPLHVQETHPTIKGSYMVILKDGLSATQFLAHQQLINAAQQTASAFHGASASDADGIGHIYDLEQTLQGYAGKFTDDVVEYIRALPEVDYVEMDSVVSTLEMPYDDTNIWDGSYDVSIDEAVTAQGEVHAQNVEKGAPWGLARVSHREELRLGTFSKYLYDGHGGEGVVSYIIDTGININHVEFEGRAKWGKTMPAGSSDRDGNGHGTHCAGTVASQKYGVAKKAEVVAVKVLSDSGSGSMSDVTGGVLWAVADAKKRSAELMANPSTAQAKKHRGFTANMSLGGGKSPTLDRAVDGAVNSGLAFAVAAGNENQDACNTSPAGAKGPVTVGASTIQDDRAYFSNKGKCVDVFGPGLNILSTWNTGNRSTNTISGTSMASPHTAGILSYYLSLTDLSSSSNSAATTLTQKGGSLLRFLPFSESLVFMTLQATQWLFGSVAGADEDTFKNFAKLPILSAVEPDALKELIEKLATKGALHSLDADTANLLIFNNATQS